MPLPAVALAAAVANPSPATVALAGRRLTAPVAGAPFEPRDDARSLANALNRERAARGLPALRFDDTLAGIARAHALDMATQHYFDHQSPAGLSPFDRLARANVHFGYAGENIALDASVEAADHALFASLEHRANTFEPHYVRVGVGAIRTTNGEVFVELFSD